MKVMHISSARTMRGGEHQVCLLINNLSELGIKNILLCPTGSELSKEEIPGLQRLVTYRKLSPANILVSAFIRKLSVQEGVDLIHLHDPHSHQFAFYSYRLFSNPVPAVVTRRVSFPIKSTSRPYYTHTMIKRVISVSDSVERSLSSLQLDGSKLAVISSGIVLDVESEKYSLREKFNIDPNKRIIGNLAAISPQKDFITFVKAADVFLNQYDHNALFVIIGADQGSKANVNSLIRKLGISEHILFAGYIAGAYKYLSDVDVLLSTSVSEGLGNTIQEAMKYRVPIVATNCEGTIDLVRDKKSALLANVGDYKQLAALLNTILIEYRLVDKLTENAFTDIQKYDIIVTSKQVLELYKEVLSTA